MRASKWLVVVFLDYFFLAHFQCCSKTAAQLMQSTLSHDPTFKMDMLQHAAKKEEEISCQVSWMGLSVHW